jgi:GSCFA family protein
MNPYENLEPRAFWSTGVARHNMFDIGELWQPKFNIKPRHRIATFGSCFAQHIGRALAKRNYGWLDTEPAPIGLKPSRADAFNYGIFTSRTGNIYTVSLLKQWTEWALGHSKPPTEIWEKDGRFYDPFRPRVEPNGFASRAELKSSREVTIEAFRAAIVDSDVFVFTLGLTESWFNRSKGYEYPMCPGTVAGEFDEKNHVFVNQDYTFIYKNLQEAMMLMREINPSLRFLLTVSPVPLTATNSGHHVLVATMQSKSILRAVAGQLATLRKFVDYFPSYEIINSAPFRGVFFDPNVRTVNHHGVDHVMSKFFEGLGVDPNAPPPSSSGGIENQKSADVVCEEELLGAFGGSKS